MRGKTVISAIVIGVAAVVIGWFVNQPLRGQPKDEKAAVTPGRYQAVPMAAGDFGVLDTATGQTWKYAAQFGIWGDLGVPAEEVKKKR